MQIHGPPRVRGDPHPVSHRVTGKQKTEPTLVQVIEDAPFWEFELPPHVRHREGAGSRKPRPLSPGSVKFVAIELAKHFNRERNGDLVWPSVELLAGLTGLGTTTVRAALHRLCQLEFIKIRSDLGRCNGYSLNEEIIRSSLTKLTAERLRQHKAALRARSDPSHHGRGLPFEEPDPLHHGWGTPSTMVGDPLHHDQQNSQGNCQEELPTGFPSFGHSPIPKIGDGDHQRKIPLLGDVAKGALEGLAHRRELPNEEKREEAEPDDGRPLAAGARQARERPG